MQPLVGEVTYLLWGWLAEHLRADVLGVRALCPTGKCLPDAQLAMQDLPRQDVLIPLQAPVRKLPASPVHPAAALARSCSRCCRSETCCIAQSNLCACMRSWSSHSVCRADLAELECPHRDGL